MKKILIVIGDYYPKISKGLERSALLELKTYKVTKIFAPGVFEIPVIISKNINKYDGFLALGCVIKGETPHFDFISASTINAIMNIAVQNKKPIGNAILTCLNKKQALARLNKGKEAAIALKQVLKNGTIK